MIDDDSFFDSIPHTLVTFEDDGSGNPVVLLFNVARDLPAEEYAALGFSFDQDIEWRNDLGGSFDAAQAIGGSPDIMIPGSSFDDFRIEFSIPVLAFGFWVIDNNQVAEVPVFTAMDSAGDVIETVTFAGSLVDGTVGAADYGFMGIRSATPIASVRITKSAAGLDNFRFTAVPEATGATLLIVGMVGRLAHSRRGWARQPCLS